MICPLHDTAYGCEREAREVGGPRGSIISWLAPAALDRYLGIGRFAPLNSRVRAFAAFGDETVDPRGDNGQRR